MKHISLYDTAAVGLQSILIDAYGYFRIIRGGDGSRRIFSQKRPRNQKWLATTNYWEVYTHLI